MQMMSWPRLVEQLETCLVSIFRKWPYMGDELRARSPSSGAAQPLVNLTLFWAYHTLFFFRNWWWPWGVATVGLWYLSRGGCSTHRPEMGLT